MPTKTVEIKKNYPQKISMYAVLTLILLAGATYYCYTQYTSLAMAQTAIQTEQEQADLLATTGDQFAKDYTNMKTAFETDYKSTLDAIKAVFPPNEDYTEFTRQLDTYFLGNDSPADTLFNDNLNFSAPQYPESKDYAVLPFTMTVEASKTNFDKFLRYIENSGSLEDETRLMDVRSISINFPAEEEQGVAPANGIEAPKTLSLNFSMNTYFQKPTTQK